MDTQLRSYYSAGKTLHQDVLVRVIVLRVFIDSGRNRGWYAFVAHLFITEAIRGDTNAGLI